MPVCRLRERHQHAGVPQTANSLMLPAPAADRQVGMLQQSGNLIAEAMFHQLWVLHC